MPRKQVVSLVLAGLCLTASVHAQSAERGESQAPASEPQEKRLFGIIPNYRTSPSLERYVPLSAGEKFKLATKDAFDPGTFVLSAAFAGEEQLTNASPSFGQGAKGYAHYFVTSYANWAIGDYMTEAVFPALLHQDPRYFRKGTGSGMKRLTYAIGQSFWTHTDSGGHMFNFSEVGGNAAGAAIAQAYYPDDRTAGKAASTFAVQIGVDTASNIVKEFYPDIRRHFSKKHAGH